MLPKELALWHQEARGLLQAKKYVEAKRLCLRLVSINNDDDESYALLFEVYRNLGEWVMILELFEHLGLRVWQLGSLAVKAIVEASAQQQQMLFINVSAHLAAKNEKLQANPHYLAAKKQYAQTLNEILPKYRKQTNPNIKFIDYRFSQLLAEASDNTMLLGMQTQWYQLFNQLCESDYITAVQQYLLDGRLAPFVRAEMLRTLACFAVSEPTNYLLANHGIITVIPKNIPDDIEHTEIYQQTAAAINHYFVVQKDPQQLRANLQLLKATLAVVYPCMDDYPNLSQADYFAAIKSLFVPTVQNPAAKQLADSLQKLLHRYL